MYYSVRVKEQTRNYFLIDGGNNIVWGCFWVAYEKKPCVSMWNCPDLKMPGKKMPGTWSLQEQERFSSCHLPDGSSIYHLSLETQQSRRMLVSQITVVLILNPTSDDSCGAGPANALGASYTREAWLLTPSKPRRFGAKFHRNNT